eukprot:FR739248.1.p1 GENE.FR739248.1~~FR739248.1.p1  ORF type:complete len:261 (+),score=28.03 FR739248.1:1-783(+)
MIGDLRLKMDGMQKEILHQKGIIDTVSEYISKFRGDLQATAHCLDDNKRLKTAVRGLYKSYVQEEMPMASAGQSTSAGGGRGGEMEIQYEYNRQREFLERNVEALKGNIGKDIDMFMSDHARLMRESVTLTEEMNHLRREAKQLRRRNKMVDEDASALPTTSSAGGTPDQLLPTPPHAGRSLASSSGNAGRSLKSLGSASRQQQTERELEMQRTQLKSLEYQFRGMQTRMAMGSEFNHTTGSAGAVPVETQQAYDSAAFP